ncbi:hypothetical protein Trydic_g11711 [Trypoxylus dichotomus]
MRLVLVRGVTYTSLPLRCGQERGKRHEGPLLVFSVIEGLPLIETFAVPVPKFALRIRHLVTAPLTSEKGFSQDAQSGNGAINI